jgi:hypothetical protein
LSGRRRGRGDWCSGIWWRGEALEKGAGFWEKGASCFCGNDIGEDLAGGLGSIFLNLYACKADGGSGAESVSGLGCHDSEEKSLGGGAVSAGGKLVGLGKAGGRSEGMGGEVAGELFIEGCGFTELFF